VGCRLGGVTRLFTTGRSIPRPARRFDPASAIPACASHRGIDLGAYARVEFHQNLQCALLLSGAHPVDPAGDPGGKRSAHLGRLRAFVSDDAPETPMGSNKRCHDRVLWEGMSVAMEGLWRFRMYVSNGC